jgi:uncharacterized protein
LKSTNTGNFNFIKLDKGEDVLQCLNSFAVEKKLSSGFLTGIGVLKNIELGYFDLKKNSYDIKLFEGEYELLSLMGNIAICDGKPTPHIHVVLGDKDFKCFGGHLIRGFVGVTCEMVLAVTDMNIERIYDPETKLSLLTPINEGSKK